MTRQHFLARLDFAAAVLAAVAALLLGVVAVLVDNGWLERHGTSVQPIPLLLMLGWSAGGAPLFGLAGWALRRGWWLRWLMQAVALLWGAAPGVLQGVGWVKWF